MIGRQKLFIRFLKNEKIYYQWLILAIDAHGNYINFLRWFDSCSSSDYLMTSFSWSYNSHNILIPWSIFHAKWLKISYCDYSMNMLNELKE